MATAAIGMTTGASPAAAVGADLPEGFTDLVVDNPPGNALKNPTAVVPLVGNRALVLEKGGAVRVVGPDGSLLAQDALQLNVCTGSEMGLLGAAVDPAFNLNGYVYLYYTRNAGDCASSAGRFNRVSRFIMTANTIDPASELVLLDNISARGGNHDGGDLEVGQDGYLYVSVGDAGQNPRGANDTAGEDLSLLNGKILRITTTGGIPADNPFVNDPAGAPCATAGVSAPTTVKCLEVYAWGLRNPYRFAFDPNTGATRFFINDVGENTWEEVDEGGAARDYGWNNREGACVTGSTTNCPPAPAGVTDPLTSYRHGDGCGYITAGAFVPNGVWPSKYDNAYLFADGGCGKVWVRSVSGDVDYANPFTVTSGVIADMAFVVQGRNPKLYYVTNADSKLHVIVYDAPESSNDAALAFTPLPAASRAYDTRFNIGVAPGTVRAGTTRYVDLGIRSDENHTYKAALVNLTMVDSLGSGFLVASEGRTEHPETSNVNVANGEVVANSAIVPIDNRGSIVIYASVTTNVIVDVLGTFEAVDSPAPGGRYSALTPARLIDTRQPAADPTNSYAESAPGALDNVVHVPVAGRVGVPAAVKAVALIATGVSAIGQGAGFATLYPSGTPQPPTSNLNTNGNGDVRPNLVIVPLGADGAIDVTLHSIADVVLDVAGYFVDAGGKGGLYHVIEPSRQVDTRVPTGFGPLALDGTATLSVSKPVPSDAAGVAQNITMTGPLGPGYVTAFPANEPRPLASNANVTGPNQDHAALSFTKIGGGGISYYSSGGTDLVVDITGYFD
jgi:glucose/arabinose dehydrogenase